MATSPAAPTTYPVLTAGQLTPVPRGVAPPSRAPTISQTAADLAQQSIAAQVAQYHQLQQQDIADAAAQARQIGEASRAAAGFLGPGGYNLGGQTAHDYANAVAQTGGLAAGYTGQLRDDLAAQTAASQATLHSIPGNDQVLTDRGPALANTIYGLQGSLPGQALAAEGLAATTTARLLPAQLLASGQNTALGILGAGRQQAARLAPQIATAEGRLPALTQQYLGSLGSQQLKQQQLIDSEAKAQADQTYKADYLKHLQNGDSERVAHDKAIEAAGEKYHTATLALAGQRLGVERFNAQTARINANKPSAAQRPSVSIQGDSTTGKFKVTTYPNGQVAVARLPGRLGKPTSSASRGPSPPSAQDLQKDIGAINAGIAAAKAGIDPKTGKNINPITGETIQPVTTRADMIAELRLAGYFATPALAKLATKAVIAAFPSTASQAKSFYAANTPVGPVNPTATARGNALAAATLAAAGG